MGKKDRFNPYRKFFTHTKSRALSPLGTNHAAHSFADVTTHTMYNPYQKRPFSVTHTLTHETPNPTYGAQNPKPGIITSKRVLTPSALEPTTMETQCSTQNVTTPLVENIQTSLFKTLTSQYTVMKTF